MLIDGACIIAKRRTVPIDSSTLRPVSAGVSAWGALTQTSRPQCGREDVCVVVAAAQADHELVRCLESVLSVTAGDIPVIVATGVALQPAAPGALARVRADAGRLWLSQPRPAAAGAHLCAPLTAAVDLALELLWPADVALLTSPCLVTAGWLERLRAACYADTNTATASAFATAGTSLALAPAGAAPDLASAAGSLPASTLALRPRLSTAVGPCVFLRRDALELAGPLDGQLELRWAVQGDLAQRCLLSGLAHVLADDVVVAPLAPDDGPMPQEICDRYPHMCELQPVSADAGPWASSSSLAASPTLPRALRAVRRSTSRLTVTIDARALDGTITGTQRHILELITAIAATEAVTVRALVLPNASPAVEEQLSSLPGTSVARAGGLNEDVSPSTVFHRPQQVFDANDLHLAMRLGERFVVSQLDLIAYRNPAYHADPAAWRRYRRVTRHALGAADAVVVSSGHTRTELLEDELAGEQLLRIVPPGLDHSAATASRRPDALAGEPTEAPYLLCLGTDFRHKNRPFAIELLDALRSEHGWHGRLVLAGPHVPHGSSQELEEACLQRRAGLREHVLELGRVEEAEKQWLLENAAAVLYPSTYEGFGLIPLESALCGVPCVYASRSSLAEVLPGAGASIVPWDPRASAARAYELLIDAGARERHVRRLAESARRFTWRSAAAAMVGIYEEVLVAPQRPAQTLSWDDFDREREVQELIGAHDALVAALVAERDRLSEELNESRLQYRDLREQAGFGLSLVGPRGELPEDVQRALLAFSGRHGLSGPAYAAAAQAYRAARAISRSLGRPAGRRSGER